MVDYNRNSFNHNVFPPFINRNMLSSINNNEQPMNNQSNGNSEQDLKMPQNYNSALIGSNKISHANSFNPILQSNPLFSNSTDNCAAGVTKASGNKKTFGKNLENSGISSISSSSASSNSHLSVSPTEPNGEVNPNLQGFGPSLAPGRYNEMYEPTPLASSEDTSGSHAPSSVMNSYFNINNPLGSGNAAGTGADGSGVRSSNSVSVSGSGNNEATAQSSLHFSRFPTSNMTSNSNLHFGDERNLSLEESARAYSAENANNSSANTTDPTNESLEDIAKRDYHPNKSFSPPITDAYSNMSAMYSRHAPIEGHHAGQSSSDTHHHSFNSMVRAAAVLTGYSSSQAQGTSVASKEPSGGSGATPAPAYNSSSNCFYPSSGAAATSGNAINSLRPSVNSYSNMFNGNMESSSSFNLRDEKMPGSIQPQSTPSHHLRDWECSSSGFFSGLHDPNSANHFSAHSFFNPVKSSYHEPSTFANYMLPGIGKIPPNSPPMSSCNLTGQGIGSGLTSHPDPANSPKSQSIDLNNQTGNLMCDTSVNGEVDYNPRELEAFAERFKQRRIKLGVTQADVGKALGNLKLAGVGSLSQSTICRFESLTLSHNNMVALKPILQAWLEEAELEAAERLRGTEMYDSDEERKRKRTSITDSEKRSLEAFFGIQPRPSSEKIAQIAEKLNLKKNVVRVWFCNQRQKQKRMKFSTLGLLGHYSPSL